MKRNGIVWSAITDGSSIAGNGAVMNVVVSLGTNENSITSQHNIARDIRSLHVASIPNNYKQSGKILAHMEKINTGPCVVPRLFEGEVEETTVDALLRVEARMCLKLQAVGELVFDLKLRAENVGGGPRVGENSAILWVRVFGLEVTSNEAALCVTVTSDAERHIRRSFGFYLKSNCMEWIVSSKQVVRTFSEILRVPSAGKYKGR